MLTKKKRIYNGKRMWGLPLKEYSAQKINALSIHISAEVWNGDYYVGVFKWFIFTF